MIAQLIHGSADDLDSVMHVMTAAFPEQYGEAWTRSQCAGILPMTGVRLLLAAVGDEAIVGFALYRTIVDDAELLLLAVHPDARGQGVGGMLLANFVAGSKQAGAKRIHLEVRDGNSAISLYQGAGFQQANRRRNYYRGRDGVAFDALTFILAETD